MSMADTAGLMWSYSPMITSRRMTTTMAMIAFICKGSTRAPYTGSQGQLLQSERSPLLPAGKQSCSTSSRGRQLSPGAGSSALPQAQPCLLPVLLTLQSRHHICLRRCLALLLKAAALSDKLSVKGKKRVSSVVHRLSQHPLTCSSSVLCSKRPKHSTIHQSHSWASVMPFPRAHKSHRAPSVLAALRTGTCSASQWPVPEDRPIYLCLKDQLDPSTSKLMPLHRAAGEAERDSAESQMCSPRLSNTTLSKDRNVSPGVT